MMTREGSTKIINLMTPRAGVPVLGHVHIGHIVKMHYFSEDLLYSWPLYRQTEYKVLISMEVCTKILNFMTPSGPDHPHPSHYTMRRLSFKVFEISLYVNLN